MGRSASLPDCLDCGACCVNAAANVAAKSVEYIEIDANSTLLRSRRHAGRLVYRAANGRSYLRLVDGGRCAALRGAIGIEVSCSVYELRPSPCKRVMPGDKECLRARQEQGLVDPSPVRSSGVRRERPRDS